MGYINENLTLKCVASLQLYASINNNKQESIVGYINENQTLKCKVVVKGVVLGKFPSHVLAEGFVAKLPPESISEAKIVPITDDGKEVLLG